MAVIVVLVGAALLVAAGFLLAFLWAVRSGQYDDLHTPALRMLHGKNQEHHLDDQEPETQSERR